MEKTRLTNAWVLVSHHLGSLVQILALSFIILILNYLIFLCHNFLVCKVEITKLSVTDNGKRRADYR